MLNRRGFVVLVAALAGAALTARLGLWQLDRAAGKIALQEAEQRLSALPPLPQSALARDAATAAAQRHRSVQLEGRWLADRTVYLDNRQMNERPGFYAVTPLRLPDGTAVLVQRGWMPRDPMDRTHLVAPPPPSGDVHLLGRIATGFPRLYEFAGAASGPIRQNLDIEAFAREASLPLRPLAVVQIGDADASPDGLLRQWPQPAAGVQTHYGYAFQWFALCALIIGLYVWFQLIRPRRADSA